MLRTARSATGKRYQLSSTWSGDGDFSQSLVIDFPSELQRKAAAELVEALD